MGRIAEIQRKHLEQLMGAESMGITVTDISLWDPKVCKPFTTGICPHDLFTNTKMDLGSCARTHSTKVKNEYTGLLLRAEADKDETKIAELNRLRVEYENIIRGFVDECDRRIRAAQRRLEKTPEENNRTTALMREIGEIEGAYQSAMQAVEQLGSEGKVDESMAELVKGEALKAEKVEKEQELQQLTETSGASGHQKLRVCDICGAYLSILDSDRRLADHFGGKMHLGYLQLRTSMEEWQARGPLPVAPMPTSSFSNVPNGVPPTNGNNWSRSNSSMAPPAAARPEEKKEEKPKVAPVAFRPITPGMKGTQPASDRDSGRGERSDRDRSDRDRSDRDRSDRERSDRRRDDDRDRGSSSRRSDDHRSSSSRYDDDRHRSSSRRDDDRDRDHHRSSSSRHADEDRDRSSSSRHADDDRDRSRHSSSRRDEPEKGDRESGARRERKPDEAEDRLDKEKRRRVE